MTNGILIKRLICKVRHSDTLRVPTPAKSKLCTMPNAIDSSSISISSSAGRGVHGFPQAPLPDSRCRQAHRSPVRPARGCTGSLRVSLIAATGACVTSIRSLPAEAVCLHSRQFWGAGDVFENPFAFTVFRRVVVSRRRLEGCFDFGRVAADFIVID